MYKFNISDSDYKYEVYVNLINSSAGRYLSRRPYVLALIKELLASRKLRGNQVVIEEDMGRNIGTTDIVSTASTDTIYYAQPIKSAIFSRFAKNRYPQPSKKLTIVLDRDVEGNYEVSNAWIGSYFPAFPGDENETADSKEYWQNHALVHEAQVIQAKSITKDCPY